MIKKIIQWWRSLRYYVIADPADNSITLSKRLFHHIKDNAAEGDAPVVFVFRIPEDGTFGFMLNPGIEQPTQMCEIQYNDKHKCVGFESLCPSVGRIFYDYGLGDDKTVIFSVSVRRINGKIYYQFDRPDAKHIRK